MRYLSHALVSCVAIIGVIGLVATSPAAGQVSPAGANTFQTPWGDPDLQGIWANDVSTPLERPSRFDGKAELTGEELALLGVCP